MFTNLLGPLLYMNNFGDSWTTYITNTKRKSVWLCYGKTLCPNFASIYVTEWEEAALSKCSKSPLLYLRYLD